MNYNHNNGAEKGTIIVQCRTILITKLLMLWNMLIKYTLDMIK